MTLLVAQLGLVVSLDPGDRVYFAAPCYSAFVTSAFRHVSPTNGTVWGGFGKGMRDEELSLRAAQLLR